MPIPFILAGAGILAAGVGLSANADAKKTNEEAQRIAQEAQEMYDDAKASLEANKTQTENALLKLGNAKKKVLDTSMHQFLDLYEQIKDVEVTESAGLNEIKNFMLDPQGAVQLREMANIYEASLASRAAGAATGAIVALAASGNLAVVTGAISAAGSLLTVGEIGAAASIAGSALSLGAAMTPLAAVAAPVLLFTGISASLKADENLEKAQTMYAESEAAVEEMKTMETLCQGIAKRSEMFGDLLNDLNVLFIPCVTMLGALIKKKKGFFGNRTINRDSFTKEELQLIAVTRALAGAVKAVIDTPILTKEGTISPDADILCEKTRNELPAFTSAVETVKQLPYQSHKAQPASPAKAAPTRKKSSQGIGILFLDVVRNLFALSFALFNALMAWGFMVYEDVPVEAGPILLAFAITMLLFMNHNTTFRLFRACKSLACFCLWAGGGFYFFDNAYRLVYMQNYIVIGLVLTAVFFIACALALSSKKKSVMEFCSFRRTMIKIFGCGFFFIPALFVFAILFKTLHLSFVISMAVSLIAYMFFSMVFSFSFIEKDETKTYQ